MANANITRPFANPVLATPSAGTPSAAAPDPLATSRPAGGTDPMGQGGYSGTSADFGKPTSGISSSIPGAGASTAIPTPGASGVSGATGNLNSVGTLGTGWGGGNNPNNPNSNTGNAAYDAAVNNFNKTGNWSYQAGNTNPGALTTADIPGYNPNLQSAQGAYNTMAYDQNYAAQQAAGNVQGGAQTPGAGQTATNNGAPAVLNAGWDPYLTAIAQSQNPGGQINNMTPGSNQPGFNWNQASLNQALPQNQQIFSSGANAANGQVGPQPTLYNQGSMADPNSSTPTSTYQNGQWSPNQGTSASVTNPNNSQYQGPQPVGGNMSGQGGAAGTGNYFGMGGSPGGQPYSQPFPGMQGNPQQGMFGGFNSWGNPYQGNPFGYMTGQPNNYAQTMYGGGQLSGNSGFNNQGVYGGNPSGGGNILQSLAQMFGGSNPMQNMNQMGGLGGLLQLFSNMMGAGGQQQQQQGPQQYNPNPQQYGMYTGA